ncbi:MAG: hypothetical protein OHK0013_49540 [Sandaracinaceae bacterium]
MPRALASFNASTVDRAGRPCEGRPMHGPRALRLDVDELPARLFRAGVLEGLARFATTGVKDS